MRITLVTPAKKGSRSGNRATALRWARLLRGLGHRVTVAEGYDGAPADAMVAIHAWRSAEAVRDFRSRHPNRPLILCLAGTDIYRFQESDPATTYGTMDRADLLVGLHDLVGNDIPARFRDKLRIIRQSAPPLPPSLAALGPPDRHFAVCVVGHLRDEKDPLCAAEAAALLPAESRIRVTQLGRAHDESWAERARAEATRNPRYRWLGEVSGWAVRRAMARSHLMVVSSRMEGGANVVSEAVVAGLPVIASNIPGNLGLLGQDYPGVYPVGDREALARLLRRAETDPDYVALLRRRCAERAPLFTPAREAGAWRALLESVPRATLKRHRRA